MDKQCSRCKEVKDVSMFCKMSRSKDGYQPACKVCMAGSWRRSRAKKIDHYMAVQKSRRHDNAKKIKDWKVNVGCYFCEEKEPECLDLHHLDPSTKESNPSDLSKVSFGSFLKEAEKCVVVCANCHRKVHSGKLTLSMA